MTDMLLLLVAIAGEVLATMLLKASDGLSRLWPSVLMAVGFLGSYFLLAVVLVRLPIGPVYAVWAGLGTAGTALCGKLVYREQLPGGGWLGIVFVIAGVVLLAYNTANGH